MSVKYSIILPVYNVAPFLGDCLDSLLEQKFSDWEAICVDDGSGDGSGDILDEYFKRDGRIRVIHQQNVGVANARNVGLSLAKGEWVLFVDADDLVSPDLFEVLNQVIDCAINFDLVVFDTVQFKEFEHPIWARETKIRINKVDCSSYCDERFISLFSVWGKAFRRTTLNSIKFDVHKISEDYLFMVRYVIRAKKILAINIPCYGYRQRASSVMHSRLTYTKIRDIMNANAEVIRVMSLTNKRFSRRIRRLTARQLFDLSLVRSATFNKEVKDKLYRNLKIYAQEFWFCRVLPLETRVRLFLLRCFAFNDFALEILFGLPVKVKTWLKTWKK